MSIGSTIRISVSIDTSLSTRIRIAILSTLTSYEY